MIQHEPRTLPPTTMSTPEVLTLAVCLFPNVQLLDYAGPVDLLGFISADRPIDSGLMVDLQSAA